MTNLKSVEESWRGFADMVFRGMSPTTTQITEMRKAFFAGAWAMFSATEEIGEEHVTEDQGFAYLDSRRVEMLEFKRQLMAEYSERN